MPSVFVSYAREDARKAKAIARAFEDASLDVWFDERIRSGSEYSTEIEQALSDAVAVVVLWSRDSILSPWVRDEAAEGRDSRRLVPVLLDKVRPPMGFRQFQSTDLSTWSGRGTPKQIEDIIAAIRAKGGSIQGQKDGTDKPPRRRAFGSQIGWAAAGLAAVALIAAAFLFEGTFKSQPTSPPSLAILPFTADPADADARKLASAAHDAVAHTLSQGAFAVSTVDAGNAPAAAPADYLIRGQVTSTADKFLAAVRMEETAHHYVVFSRQFETSRDKSGEFAELIGAQVAAVLSWTAPILTMERRHPSDPAITASLLQSSAERLDSIATLHDYETSRRLAARAPNSPLAQNSFAFNTAFALGDLPRAVRSDAVAAARRAVDRTIQLAPEYGGGYIPWCLLRSEQRWIECEDKLREGMRADPDGPFNDWFLAIFLNNVGRNREATELARLSLAHDQYMPFKIALMLRLLDIDGRWEDEASLYRTARRWWPGNEAIAWYRWTGTTQSGDYKALERLQREMDPKGEISSGPIASLFAAVRANSLTAGRNACSRVALAGDEGILCMLALARLGDMDGAYRFADALYPSRRGRTAAEEERIWLDKPDPNLTAFLVSPAAAPLRNDRRYVALAQRVGLLEYWRSGRPPDFCRATKPEPICRRLLARA